MNCDDQVTKEFKFSKEQSSEFRELTYNFLDKHFSKNPPPFDIEIEVRFVPRQESLESLELLDFQASSMQLVCRQGTPQSSFCRRGQTWVEE
jgi:hypothetical protein